MANTQAPAFTHLIDLAVERFGGKVLWCTDDFFAEKENLIKPGRSQSMRDGWETRRRSGPGHDWAIVKLGHPGRVRKVVLDTAHFKGNYPDRASLDVFSEA